MVGHRNRKGVGYKLVYSARAFSVSGPTLWNLLPAHLRVAKNISSFRKLLKTHFFDLAFPP